MADDPTGRETHARPAMVYGLIAICILIEGILFLGDLDVFGLPRFRALVYEYGGFWQGLLGNWQPNFFLQPYAMFFTYGFLHAGLFHLVVNMITLASLGSAVTERVGNAKFALIYAGSILGGGAGFAVLSESFRPMVGASGALFGLAGALLAWNYVDRFNLRQGLWPVARTVMLLIALNVLLYFAMGGLVAWETHLGGFVAGWLTATLVDPRPRQA